MEEAREPSRSEFWERLWKAEEEFLGSGDGAFRHDASFVAVSSIAQQYYCEYKVENEFKFGEVPTEAKAEGTDLHDELIPLEEISGKEFASLVGGKEPAFAVMRVWGSVGGLKVIGTPDHIIWKGGKPLWLMELKTTRGDPNPLWEDQENQVRVYGLLLERMGFDCSELKLAVVRVKAGELADDQKQLWLLRVSAALMEARVGELEQESGRSLKVHVLNHDSARAERAVAAKAGYWLREREPESSSSPGKCRACEFAKACEKSLARD